MTLANKNNGNLVIVCVTAFCVDKLTAREEKGAIRLVSFFANLSVGNYAYGNSVASQENTFSLNDRLVSLRE